MKCHSDKIKCPQNKSNVKSKILIVDDHELFRDRLKRFISETSDMAVTDEAGNGHEALDKAGKNDFDEENILILRLRI